MDVPVALGLSIAFTGSAFATVTGEGEVWFDSVVMFVTLLSGARYLELLARRRATAAIRALARSAPLVATRVRRDRIDADGCDDGGDTERIPAAALRPGDRVRVRPGEVVPADGVIRSGHSAFDESLLTGESNPIARSESSRVLAGSVNGAGVVEVEVTSSGDETVLGGVLRRSEQAARERPAIARLADRAAAWFIGGVLVLAAGVAFGWLLHDPARMIPVLVSVLVVTCPCALSLATPAAMTSALGALARTGLIATRANAVERLALATHCLADKTGTLTEGRFRLRSITTFTDVSESRCLALAAALERYATHPAATALVAAADKARSEEDAPVARRTDTAESESEEPAIARASATESAALQSDRTALKVEDPDTRIGGVTGCVDGAPYAVGSRGFVGRTCRLDPDAFAVDRAGSKTSASSPPGGTRETTQPAVTNDADAGTGPTAPGISGTAGNGDGATQVFLAGDQALLARFTFADALHPGARALVDGLRQRGIETTIASGDSPAAVGRAARDLGVARHLAGLPRRTSSTKRPGSPLPGRGC